MKTELKMARNLSIPVEAVTQTFGILAIKGVGKSYLASVMAEEMLEAGQQIVAIDPTGSWWGLREGYPVVIVGGEHADVPIEPAGGRLIADMVVDTDTSFIIDTSEMEESDMIQFMTAFCKRLYQRNKLPLHLFLDEADMFAPQQMLVKEIKPLLMAVKNIVQRGRKKGLGVSLITQRSSVISKDCLSQVEVLICLRTVHSHDRAAIKAWISGRDVSSEQTKELLDSLPSMEKGEAWWWSPGWLGLFKKVKIRKRRTFDSGATPKIGQRLTKPKNMKSVDIAKLGEQMAAVVERAKQNDPDEIRKLLNSAEQKIRSLEHQIEHAGSEVKTEIEEIKVAVPFIPKTLLPIAKRLQESEDHSSAIMEELCDEIERCQNQAIEALEKMANQPPAKTKSATHPSAAPKPPRNPDGVNSLVGDVVLPGNARKLLEALCSFFPGKMTKANLATAVGMKKSGGTFGNYISALNINQLIIKEDGFIVPTQQAFSFLGERIPAPKSPQEILEMWKSKIPGRAAEMLQILVDRYPQGILRVELGEAMDMVPTGGTFGNYISVLSTNDLITKQSSFIYASEDLI